MSWIFTFVIGMIIGAIFGWVMDKHAGTGSLTGNVISAVLLALFAQWLFRVYPSLALAGVAVIPVIFFSFLGGLLYSAYFEYNRRWYQSKN